ncbi:uncharacterized protein LOC120274110 [Dioscorea cayenensis subsp. rotundata]|uniref:Uncharacterized protein LOC120274110 n=1 Tax=Dioscorea cayennensis subsp. rotundata TaxID=55577 RepID=A0AB40CAA0_DIOCR|nr:uncharacterized protein LOC120274110 [Dioscorea cayenensis subsp. rotundata]
MVASQKQALLIPQVHAVKHASRPTVKDNEVQKRGSMYHSSREVRKMRKQREGERNLKPVDSKEAFLSFEIKSPLWQVFSKNVDMICPFRHMAEEQSRPQQFMLRRSRASRTEDEELKDSLSQIFCGTHQLVKQKLLGSLLLILQTPRKSRQLCKSLLNDFSDVAEKTEFDDCFIGEDPVLMAGSSPAHLHGTLRLEFKYGVPSFEFSVKDPELQLSAKAMEKRIMRLIGYTPFRKEKQQHSMGAQKDRQGQSPSVIGQMHATCYLCSSMNDNGCVDNSMVTEFVLHDMALAKNRAMEEGGHYSSDSVQIPTKNTNASSAGIRPLDTNDSSPACDPICSASLPWTPVDVQPQNEIAAIVIQIPFGKKDDSKALQTDEVSAKECPNLSSPANMKVVTPSGSHGLPNTKGGPSSLLDRWRTGGGCDCGGWDMGCPIVIFDNSRGSKTNHTRHESQKLMMLFSQGKKDKVPALTVTAEGKGVYSVQFHAQLSALQAFSICIAMLHGSETSGGCEENRLRLYSNSLKLLLEEEVRNLIEAVAKDEKKKTKKRLEQIHPSFLLDPPFSPIGRV